MWKSFIHSCAYFFGKIFPELFSTVIFFTIFALVNLRKAGLKGKHSSTEIFEN